MTTPIGSSPAIGPFNTAQKPLSNPFLTHVVKLPDPIKLLALEGLDDRQLDSFRIALAKGVNIDNTYQKAYQNLKKMCASIIENRKKRTLENLLKAHPDWKNAISTWQNVSLDDKIWLILLYDYQNHEFFGSRQPIAQIKKLHNLPTSTFKVMPNGESLKLLTNSNRNEISNFLASIESVTTIDWQFENYPEAICLLTEIDSFTNELGAVTVPPNLKQCLKLSWLKIEGKLTTPPDLSQNTQLTRVEINYNQLTTPPDVRRSSKLKTLSLGGNKKLQTYPDVSQNPELDYFDLSNNALTLPPDVINNKKLRVLKLDHNQLTTLPNLSNNLNLEQLHLEGNPLTKEAEKSLVALKAARPNLRIYHEIFLIQQEK